MSEWKNAKQESPKESGWYFVAFWHKSELFENGGFWTHGCVQYCAELQGWNTFVGDEHVAEHMMFPDFWMPIPEMEVSEVES